MNKKRLAKRFSILLIAFILTIGVFHYIPLSLFSIQQKPEQPLQKKYVNYTIYEEETGEILMYVPLVVSVGDELISENNKRYKIVKVEENQAYARFVENLNLEQYKQ
ncbi:MAG: stage II sporulation protein P [Sporomusa sp.]